MLTADSFAGTAVAVVILLVVIGVTVALHRVPPAVVAVPAALLLIATGLAGIRLAMDEITFMAPTIGFLAAMLVIADVCARRGVFDWIGAVLARLSGGSPTALLRLVFVAAAVTTAVLSIDTTIVLLTPVAVATALRLRDPPEPAGYASVHLANSASTLLPVSNLTNLLAFGATGLGFLQFAGVMAAPWLAAIAVEYIVFRWFFAGRLAARTGPAGRSAATTVRIPDRARADAATPAAPRSTLVMLGLLLVGFVVAEPLRIPLAVVAAAGAVGMGMPLLIRAPAATLRRAVRAADLGFLAFVAALGVIVLPVREGLIGEWIGDLVPADDGFVALLAIAVLAALVANVLNNLPATLLLVPLVAHQPALVLAVLLGVNIGPNLTYFGSLANLLWRDAMRRAGVRPSAREFVALGLCTVPPTLIAAVAALWVGVRLL
ncbi:ArsB/NhaD family transporter [Gordonia sinesedis]